MAYPILRLFGRILIPFRRPRPPAPPPVVIHAANPVPIPDGGGGSDWTETFVPVDGGIDVWTAVRMKGGQLQAEYELTCRQAVTIGTLTVNINGLAPFDIVVNREWPAGRAICGRLGPEFDLDAAWNPSATGPLDMPLPTLPDAAALPAVYSARLATLRATVAAIRAGNPNASCEFEDFMDGINHLGQAPSEGPFICWGPRDGGNSAPGGQGIYYPWGWPQCVEYARLALEIEAIGRTRMWTCVKSDGKHASVDDYLPNESPYTDDNSMVRLAGWDSGTDLLMHPQQVSHLIRQMRYCGAAWEMTRSPMAKRHIIHYAEMVRLQLSENGILSIPETHGFFSATFNTMEWVATHKLDGTTRPIHTGCVHKWQTGGGYGWSRIHGHALFTAAMAKKAGMPWTTGWIDWSTRFINALSYSQMPNGLIGASAMVNSGQYAGYPAAASIDASMHEAILGIGLAAIGYQTGNTAITTPMNIAQATAMYGNVLNPAVQYYGGWGPYHWMAVGADDGPPEYTNHTPFSVITGGYSEPSLPLQPGDPAHNETFLAVMHKLTGDSVWLDDSLLFGTRYTPATLAAKKAGMQANLANTSTTGDNLEGRMWQSWLLAQYP